MARKFNSENFEDSKPFERKPRTTDSRPKRRFDDDKPRSSRPKRSFGDDEKSSRPKRSFNNDDRKPARGRRSFDRNDDRPARRFNDEDRPKRRFNDDDRLRRDRRGRSDRFEENVHVVATTQQNPKSLPKSWKDANAKVVRPHADRKCFPWNTKSNMAQSV